jgi:Ca2+-binding RTX toxin-like protein
MFNHGKSTMTTDTLIIDTTPANPSTDVAIIAPVSTLSTIFSGDNVTPTGSPTAVLTGAVEDTTFSISEVDLLAGFSDANGDTLSIENLVATNGIIFLGNGYGGGEILGSGYGDGESISLQSAQALFATSTTERIFTFVPNANFNGIVDLTYSVTDGNSILADQTLSFNVSPVNDAPTGTPTAILANAALNSPYTINTSDLLTGFSDADGDALSIENLTASNGSLINNENGTFTFTPSSGFNGLVNLNYSVTDGIASLTNQNINVNVGSVFSILSSISDEQIITSLLGNTTGLSNFQLTTSGSRQAVGLFQNDPFSFGQGIVLSTGLVASLVGSRVGNTSTAFSNPGTVPGGNDAITLDITFDASITSDQIFFQYIFGSEEFTDFSGSSFNDVSTLTLNGINLARLTNGDIVTVNNLTPSSDPATFSPDYINNDSAGSSVFSQLALDGFTRPLGFAGTLIPGASNRLVITVQDISDGILDSAIFLRANTLGIEQLPGVVQFLAPSYSVDENNTTLATITIIRTGGDNGVASIQLNLSDGTATATNDYLNEPITISFAAGESIRTITVPIIDDNIVESNETVNLTLSNPSSGLTVGAQSTAVLTILANDNIAPTGSPTATLTGAAEDTAFIISAVELLAGFSDVNGDNLSITNLFSSSGSIINNENGTFTFNPSENFNGDVTLFYGVTDGLATLASQTLTFNVAAVNDAPTGTPIAVLNDAAAGSNYIINASDLLIGFSDIDGDTLSIENLVATNGNLVDNGDGVYTFTPNTDFIGVVNLTYDVTDGIAFATNESLSFNVISDNTENNAPEGGPTAVLPDTNEDVALVINTGELLAGFSDVDGDVLSVANIAATNGTLVDNNNGTFTFTPEANFNGEVTLVYDVTDGVAALTEQVLSFNVLAINDVPTGLPTITLPDATEDEAFVISASDLLTGFSDVDEDTLSVVNLVASNGTLENIGNDTFVLTPGANFNGTVTLTYDVSDGVTSVTNQTRSLNVVAVNDSPTGSPTAVLGTSEDTPFIISASELLAGFSDVDEDTLSVVNLVASNGTLINNEDGSYGFTPNANFNGEVVLTYEVSDGTETLTEQSLSFNVTAVNDIPTGSPTSILIGGTEDTSFTISAGELLAGFIDIDGDTLTFANVTTNDGTVIENIDGTYTFTPNANINGLVNLTYDISDGTGAITGQTLSFNLTAVNDAPTGLPTANLLGATEDNAFTIIASDLLSGFSDVDGDILSIVNLVASNGTLIENEDGNYTFTPDANFNGEVLLTYGVSDGTETLTEQSISFNVAAVNDIPTGSPIATLPDATEDTAFTISISDLLEGFSDVDGDVLSIANLVASNGTLTDNGNETYTFSPNTNFNGAVTLTYDVTDGFGTLASQTLNFNVAAVNDAPIGSPTATLPAVAEDTVITINVADLLAGFSDVEGDTLSVTNLVASNGTLIDNGGGIFSLNPEANFNGEVTLTYDVTDGLESLTAQSLSFNINAVNDAPIGSPTATLSNTAEDFAIVINASDLLVGFSDVDGDTLSIINLVANNGALVNNNNGTYNFTPTANFNGIIDLTYDVTDGAITLTGQTQSFGVTPVNDAPTLQQLLEDQSTGQNQPFTFTIPSNTFADVDAGDTLTLSAALANGNPLPSWLSFNPATQTFSGTPPLVNIGSLNIRVTATDSAGASVSDVFALDVGLNIVGTLQADNLIGSNGFDTISGLNGNDTIDGGRGADRLDGGSGNDRLLGGTGRDTLIGGTGNDTLDGGTDDDSYEASGTQAEFDTFNDTGVAGSDTLVNIGSTALTLNGFSLANGIESINGNNQAILGNNNANVLNFSGVSLNSVLFIGGGSGNDSITGNSANNDLRGNNGDDTIDGGAGDDWLDGGSQNDRLLGAAGDDTIIGGSGTDTLDGGEGNDTYNVVGNQAEFDIFTDSGTSGTDTLSNLAGTALTLSGFALTNGIDVINGNNQAIIGNNNGNTFNFSAVTFNSVSFVSGGNGDDSIIGTALSDNLQGASGNDTISGGAGADRLDGGAQNDILLGGIGDDTLVGGTGNDTLDGGEGSDNYEVAITQAEFDLFTDTGTSGNDTLRNTGNSSLTLNGFSITNGLEFVDGNNREIRGNNNNNSFNFSAVALSNVLFVDGGNGNDFLVGSAASDNLRGGNGNDTIDGGNGADSIFGGAGNDSFIFNSANAGIDTINDFTIGGDTLQISSAGFGGAGVVGTAGVLAAARFTTGTAATTAAQRFVYDNASGSLFFDIDGNGSTAQVQIALLNTRPALNNNSFLVF